MKEEQDVIERLESALRFIVAWVLPRVQDRQDPTRTISYSTAYGSMGEREYMRSVAGKALSALDAARARDERDPAIEALARVENANEDQRLRNVVREEIAQGYGVLRATIADLEGKMLTITGGLHNAIDRVEASIDALARRLTGITAQHAELMGKVTALERGSASGATVRCSRCGLHGPASDADRHARDCDGPPARAKPDPKCMECGETLPFEDGEEHVCAPTRPAPSSGEEDETAEARRRVCSLMREPLNRERSSFEVNQFMVQAEIESACAAARVDERAAALRDARFAVREYEDARRIIGDMLRSLPSAPPAAEAGGREGKRG